MFFFKKNNAFQFYVFVIIITITTICCQFFFKKNLSIIIKTSCYDREKEENNGNLMLSLNNALEAKLIVANNKIRDLSLYEDIYEKLHNEIRIKSFLNIFYINDNNNGKYIVAKNNNNVLLNDLVVNKYGILVGRIIATTKDGFVKIQLINDENANIPVEIKNSKIYGIATGMAKKHSDKESIVFQTDFIENVKDEDLVITSGRLGLIPRGIVVGKIKKVGTTAYIVSTYKDNIVGLAVIDTKISFNTSNGIQ